MPDPRAQDQVTTIQTILEAQGLQLPAAQLERLVGPVEKHRREAEEMRAALRTADEPADIFVPLRRAAMGDQP